MLFAEYLDGIAFQSTLPQGERQMDRPQSLSFCAISIHAPTRGATQIRCLKQTLQKISIHAPTRGATMSKRFLPGSTGISIHAPTRGATSSQLFFAKWQGNFNPRSHKGSDWYIRDLHGAGEGISIHAPTRGATSEYYSVCMLVPISIHAPTRGATR